jgi:hypothetical protein
MLENNDEQNKLKQFEQNIKIIESTLNKETSYWDEIVKNLSNNIRGDIKKLIDTQAEVVSYKQIVLDEIRKYSLMMYKDLPMLKNLKKNRFEFYSNNYQLSLKNSSDKFVLIEADIAKIQYKIDLLETHINFLRETASNLETLSYIAKNRIQLMDILGTT